MAIAGAGRDRGRLERLVRRHGAPVRLLGRVPDDDLPDLYGSADVFALLCRSRWGGMEQEGFGIVFLEAAAAGVPSVAGASGGAAEAVVDGVTGEVLADPTDPVAAAKALSRMLGDSGVARGQGCAARARAESDFSYDLLRSAWLRHSTRSPAESYTPGHHGGTGAVQATTVECGKDACTRRIESWRSRSPST